MLCGKFNSRMFQFLFHATPTRCQLISANMFSNSVDLSGDGQGAKHDTPFNFYSHLFHSLASGCNLQFFNVLKFSLSFNEDGQNMTLIQYLFADQILTDWVPISPFPVFVWKWGSGEEEKRTLLYYYWARRLSVFPIMSVVL